MSQPPASANSPKRVFSVSFFGIVSVLLGITALATVGIPAWFSQPRITLNKAANLLASDMQVVRQYSYGAHVSCRIDFDSDGGGYSAVTAKGIALDGPQGGGPFRRDYGVDAVFRGVALKSVDFDGTRSLIFDKQGHARSNGEVVLTYRGAERTVRFDAGTAYVVREGER